MNEDLDAVVAGTYDFESPIKLSTTALMANGIFRMSESTHGVRPFFGAGIGISNVRIHDYTVSDGTNDLPVDGGTGSALAYQFLAGIEVPISESMSARIGYHHFRDRQT